MLDSARTKYGLSADKIIKGRALDLFSRIYKSVYKGQSSVIFIDDNFPIARWCVCVNGVAGP